MCCFDKHHETRENPRHFLKQISSSKAILQTWSWIPWDVFCGIHDGEDSRSHNVLYFCNPLLYQLLHHPNEGSRAEEGRNPATSGIFLLNSHSDCLFPEGTCKYAICLTKKVHHLHPSLLHLNIKVNSFF